MAVFKKRRTENFTTIHNHSLKNNNLSWKAKGILAYIMSLPEDWEIHTKELMKHASDGRDSLMSGIKELREHGYIEYKKYKDDDTGKFIHNYDVYDEPQTGNPEVENPTMENPTLENPSVKQRTNELRTNKQITNSTNSSSNSCSDKSPNEKSGDDEPKFDEDSEPYKAAVYLRRRVNDNHPKQPTPNENPKDLEDWAVELDRLNRLGTVGAEDKGYSWEEIYEIMMWCQDHHFWKNNIMSAYKFRKQIVQLEAKMKANKGDNNGKEKVSRNNRTEEEREYGEEVDNYFQF
jgi:hypothetical protein